MQPQTCHSLTQPHALAMSSPHHWHVLVPCGAAHGTKIAEGNPQVSLAACTQLWLKAGGCTLTQLLWCGHVQPAVAGSCSRSMWGRSSSVPCHRGAAGAAETQLAQPQGTATGHSQGLSRCRLEKPGCIYTALPTSSQALALGSYSLICLDYIWTGAGSWPAQMNLSTPCFPRVQPWD